MNNEFLVYDDLAYGAAEHFLNYAAAAVAARGLARIAISGGSTPKATFALLANPNEKFAKAMPWHNIELFFVDERAVPPDHAESNYRMVKEALLSSVPIKAVYRMKGELEPKQAALEYSAAVRAAFGTDDVRFDIIQLGMGDDGHTASLFSDTEGLSVDDGIAIANYVPQKSCWRISLTKDLINNARHVFFLIGGVDKAETLKAVTEGAYKPNELPAQLIKPRDDGLTYLVDKHASVGLPI